LRLQAVAVAIAGRFYHSRLITTVVLGSLRFFGLRLPGTRTVTSDRAQLEVASFQCGDAGADMEVADLFADVELVDLHATDRKRSIGSS